MKLTIEITTEQLTVLAKAIAQELQQAGPTAADRNSEPTRATLEQLQRLESPWTDRAGAAAYCSCDVSLIDRAANHGDIKRYRGNGKPMFQKSDGKGSLDAWIEGKNVQNP
jgi:hypothetical protein